MKNNEIEEPYQEYYTEKRWNNWIEKVKESGFEFKDNDEYDEDSNGCKVFVHMEDDVIISCLKAVLEFKKGVFSSEEALDKLADIHEIVFKEIEPISEDIDLMLESLRTSFESIFASCECYLQDAYDKDANLKDLLKSATDAEEKEDFETSLQKVSEIGASIINGSTLSKAASKKLSYGSVMEWVEGIESMQISVKRMC